MVTSLLFFFFIIHKFFSGVLFYISFCNSYPRIWYSLIFIKQGKLTTPPMQFFLITFLSLKLRAWNFLTLSFYLLDTTWQNFIKKYWLVNKLWHFCHQWFKMFCEENFFSSDKHMSMFFISRFFIHSLL